MASNPYTVQRTGDDAIDRNLDAIKSALDLLFSGLSSIASKDNTSNTVTVINRSLQMTSETFVSCDDVFSNTTVIVPDAVQNKDKLIQIRHTSDHSGTPIVTAAAQKLGGRQQLIAGSMTASIALGSTLQLRSDGTNWLKV